VQFMLCGKQDNLDVELTANSGLTVLEESWQFSERNKMSEANNSRDSSQCELPSLIGKPSSMGNSTAV
jgi:hypothetical protein